MKKIFLYLSITCSVLSADIFVVISEKTSLEALSVQEVKRIFLNKTRFLPNGEKVEVLEAISSEVRDSFYRLVTKKSKSQLRSYWAKQIFTGKGKPPRRLTKEKLLNYLKNNPNAISYIHSEKMIDSLKVLYKIKR